MKFLIEKQEIIFLRHSVNNQTLQENIKKDLKENTYISAEMY